MRKLTTAVLIIISLISCNTKQCSPLDDYIQATNKRFYDSINTVRESQAFIDSINSK